MLELSFPAPCFSAWADKKFGGLVFGGIGAAGNAATRIRRWIYTVGVIPEVAYEELRLKR